MKALITGAGGLLGKELHSILPAAVAYDHASLDITDEAKVWRVLTSRRVDVVFHCAAMSDVDNCEREPGWARLVNAVGARIVANVCAAVGIYLVALSTDFVFNAKPGQRLVEDSIPKPISVYGKTKLEGETAIQDMNRGAAIVRTPWLYGSWRETFADRVLACGAGGRTMSVSTDQVSSPTWVKDLAPALVRLASRRPAGILHLTGEGNTTRDEWARATLAAAGFDPSLVRGVVKYPAPARRPNFSALVNVRARNLGISLPPWRDSIEAYVASRDQQYTETVA